MTAAELAGAAEHMCEVLLSSALPEMRAEVAAALDAGGVHVVPRDHLPDARGAWDRKPGLIYLSAALPIPDMLPTFAHELAHRSQDSVSWLPSATPHHCPVFAGLACGLERRWTGRYTGDPTYDLADLPFLMSRPAAVRIARRCAVRARQMPIEAAVRASWREILLVEGLWRVGEVLEYQTGRLLLLLAGLATVALSCHLGGVLAAAETAFFLTVCCFSVMPRFPGVLDLQISLNRKGGS
ncbi:MAG: hypothetical protein HZC22_19410 [Rhodocyclales bacterium]|nr:hypothetical protein [Rhodocyclales bacterium]